MEHRSMGRSGLKVSTLAFGAMTIGDSDGFMKGVTSSEEEARRVLDKAIDLGIDTIDTANVYSEGQSETMLGKWLQKKRDRLVLATKCRFPVVGSIASAAPHEYGLSRRAILLACEQSLMRLRTDYIDLYQVHMQDGAVPIEETLSALDDLVRAGKVRYAGCSNYTGYRLTESLWAADKHDLTRYVSLQLQYSLVVRDAEREMLPAVRAFGVGTMVWSPLARGFLSGKYVRGAKPAEGTRLSSWNDTWKGLDNERSWAILDKVREVAHRREVTPAAVSLAWLLRKPEISTVIIGARTTEQLDQNLAALHVKLEDDDVRELDAVSRPAYGYPYEFIGTREPW